MLSARLQTLKPRFISHVRGGGGGGGRTLRGTDSSNGQTPSLNCSAWLMFVGSADNHLLGCTWLAAHVLHELTRRFISLFHLFFFQNVLTLLFRGRVNILMESSGCFMQTSCKTQVQNNGLCFWRRDQLWRAEKIRSEEVRRSRSLFSGSHRKSLSKRVNENLIALVVMNVCAPRPIKDLRRRQTQRSSLVDVYVSALTGWTGSLRSNPHPGCVTLMTDLSHFRHHSSGCKDWPLPTFVSTDVFVFLMFALPLVCLCDPVLLWIEISPLCQHWQHYMGIVFPGRVAL